MSRRTAVVIALGGVLGATVRWAVALPGENTTFPWWTLIVNLLGCALLGAVVARVDDPLRRAGLATGFCGGLTTFSTFAVEVAELQQTSTVVLWTYVGASLLGGAGAFLAARAVLTPGEPT